MLRIKLLLLIEQETTESTLSLLPPTTTIFPIYRSYDTDADATADSKSDYGMTTSLGYSFLTPRQKQ